MKIKKGDAVVIALVLAVASLLYGLKLLPAAAGERRLRVELDGRLVAEYAFDSETNEQILVDFPAGQAVVEIAGGRVRVLPMPKDICPRGLCSAVGWVEQHGDAIVCLPNRLVLTVTGGPVNELIDSLDGITK